MRLTTFRTPQLGPVYGVSVSRSGDSYFLRFAIGHQSLTIALYGRTI